VQAGRLDVLLAQSEDRFTRQPMEKETLLIACVAKGVDALALRIRALAEENDVAVVENPPLARALHATVEIDEPVPPEHFKAVAQVIGYVMRLQGKLPARAN